MATARYPCTCISVQTVPIPGHPLSAIDNTTIKQIETAILEDRLITKRQVVHEVNISVGVVEKIFHDLMHIGKLSARWITWLHTALQKQKRVKCAKALLTMYQDNLKDSFNRLITQNETWVHHFD